MDSSIRDEIKEHLVRNLKRVISSLLAVSTVVPFLFLLFNIFNLGETERILTAVSLGLFLLVVTESIALYAFFAKLSELSESQSKDVFYSLAFSILLNDDSQAIDQQHHYEYQKNVVDMADKTVHFEKEMRGYNAKIDEESEGVPIKLTADSQIKFDQMEIDAKQKVERDDGTEEWVEIEPCFVSQPSAFDVIIELPFKEPLDTNEYFELSISCPLGNIPTDEPEQFAFLPIHRFTKGIDEFVGEVYLDRSFTDGVAKKLGRISDVSHLRSVGHVAQEDLRLFDVPMEYQEEDRKSKFTIHETDTPNVLYVMKFSRSVTSS